MVVEIAPLPSNSEEVAVKHAGEVAPREGQRYHQPMSSLRASILLTSLGLIGAACSPAAAPRGSGDNGNRDHERDLRA